MHFLIELNGKIVRNAVIAFIFYFTYILDSPLISLRHAWANGQLPETRVNYINFSHFSPTLNNPFETTGE